MENERRLKGPYVETITFIAICGPIGTLYALRRQTGEWAAINVGEEVVFGQPLKQRHFTKVYDMCKNKEEFILGQKSEEVKKELKEWLAPLILGDVTPSFNKKPLSEPRQVRTVEEFEEEQSKKPTIRELQVWCKLNIRSLLKIAYGDSDEHIASLGGEQELLMLANGYVDLYERLRKMRGDDGDAEN